MKTGTEVLQKMNTYTQQNSAQREADIEVSLVNDLLLCKQQRSRGAQLGERVTGRVLIKSDDHLHAAEQRTVRDR